jgi:hypothetical protein
VSSRWRALNASSAKVTPRETRMQTERFADVSQQTIDPA